MSKFTDEQIRAWQSRKAALHALGEASKAMPELRLGQLLVNAVHPLRPKTTEGVAVWEATDAEIEKAVMDLMHRVTGTSPPPYNCTHCSDKGGVGSCSECGKCASCGAFDGGGPLSCPLCHPVAAWRILVEEEDT